jgi:hypothetical protein
MADNKGKERVTDRLDAAPFEFLMPNQLPEQVKTD